MRTLIIGAGWAGLSAAVHLANAGHTHITLLEAAPQAGGRARTVQFRETSVDNGQHVLMGAYQHFLTLLKILNISETQVVHRFPFSFHTSSHQLILPKAPTPFHLCLGLLRAKGFKTKEKIQLIQLARQFNRYTKDMSVLQFLKHHHQHDNLITAFWEPLVLAALSTPIAKASTHVFLKVFADVFQNPYPYSDWLYPKQDLNTLLPDPAIHYLRQRGHDIFFHQRITELLLQDNHTCIGAKGINQTWHADKIILATSSKSALKLLKPIVALSKLCNNLEKISYQPITTVYLRFKNPVVLKHPLFGLIGGTAHWIFDRTLSNNPNILSIIISGEGPHLEMSQTTLIEQVMQQLQAHFTYLRHASIQTLLDFKIITEKEAAFSCEVGIEQLRPPCLNAIANLYLAGDYTNTGYPSTLEGAVMSGYRAAHVKSYLVDQ